MGLMDKAKEAAQKAAASAQTAASQGQAKFSQYQQNQGGGSTDHAFTTLGRAFYAEQRQGGDTDAVVAALHAVDAALATPAVPPTPAPATTDGAAPAAWSPQSAPPAAAPPAGNFTLDDL